MTTEKYLEFFSLSQIELKKNMCVRVCVCADFFGNVFDILGINSINDRF